MLLTLAQQNIIGINTQNLFLITTYFNILSVVTDWFIIVTKRMKQYMEGLTTNSISSNALTKVCITYQTRQRNNWPEENMDGPYARHKETVRTNILVNGQPNFNKLILNVLLLITIFHDTVIL